MQSTSIILFGATGDLAQQKLFPTLRQIISQGQIDQNLTIFAIGRRNYSREDFLAQVRTNLSRKIEISDADWLRFAEHILYYQMDFLQAAAYPGLCQFLHQFESKMGNSNRLFYLSVPPESYQAILSYIHQSGLHEQASDHWRRIVVEKPFGYNLASAQELNKHIQGLFSEEQVYRIDHYLAKETVQNMLAFRFGNGIFEPLWNKWHIDHIQITVAEEEGIKTRAAYYDQAGAFRDFVQNHLFQLLAILSMEEPSSFSFKALSDAKMAILANLSFVPEATLFGQYADYQEEPGVALHSQTETYAMTQCFINSERWQGVPFYLRTGKKLSKRVSEISIQFKKTKQDLFTTELADKEANVLTFRLQPDEGIALRLGVKTPRQNMEIQPVQMEFCYSSAFRVTLPDAYERLFLDVLLGNQSLCLREDSIEESWRVIDQILAYKATQPVLSYPVGSWGPEQADQILAKEGRKWLAHESTICNGVTLDSTNM